MTFLPAWSVWELFPPTKSPFLGGPAASCIPRPLAWSAWGLPSSSVRGEYESDSKARPVQKDLGIFRNRIVGSLGVSPTTSVILLGIPLYMKKIVVGVRPFLLYLQKGEENWTQLSPPPPPRRFLPRIRPSASLRLDFFGNQEAGWGWI